MTDLPTPAKLISPPAHSKPRGSTYGHSALSEAEPHGQRLSHEDVRVVSRLEGALQLLQLPAVEVGPRTAPLRGRVLAVLKL